MPRRILTSSFSSPARENKRRMRGISRFGLRGIEKAAADRRTLEMGDQRLDLLVARRFASLGDRRRRADIDRCQPQFVAEDLHRLGKIERLEIGDWSESAPSCGTMQPPRSRARRFRCRRPAPPRRRCRHHQIGRRLPRPRRLRSPVRVDDWSSPSPRPCRPALRPASDTPSPLPAHRRRRSPWHRPEDRETASD